MDLVLVTLAIILCIAILAAWITHVCVCLKNNKWRILIAGIFMIPIAIVHGIGIWFGGFSSSPHRH